jgi:coenzyme F420-reducing hydrogenase beta subunit
VPCFVKAIRLISAQDPELGEQIRYTVGLVCGHLKSARFAELLAWQVGISPSRLAAVDFRVKCEEGGANNYKFSARAKNETAWRSIRSSMLYGGNWGQAFFQLPACEFCDDIFAETADIAFGDAWIPKYTLDWRGNNILVCRNPDIRALLDSGVACASICLEPLSEEDAASSQAGNLRHRWDGLSVRLLDALHRGDRVPHKRIQPGERRVSFLRKCIIRIRRQSAIQSHRAYAEARLANNLSIFTRRMEFYTSLLRYAQAAMRVLHLCD